MFGVWGLGFLVFGFRGWGWDQVLHRFLDELGSYHSLRSEAPVMVVL